MRTTIKFILHSALVVAFIALATVALAPVAKAAHSPDTTGTWFVVINWDADGNPALEMAPVLFGHPAQCQSASAAFAAYLQIYDPLRAYVSVCAYPDDKDDLDAVIDMVIEDYAKYFQPPGIGI